MLLAAGAALVQILVLAGCGGNPGSQKSSAASSTGAPDFALQSLQGDTLRLSSLKGKVVLVDFWATWCGPCKAELPHLVDLYGKYKDKGLEIVGIADDPSERADVAPFVKRAGLPYPVVYGEPSVGQRFGGIIGYPTLFVVDRKGQVVKKFIGYTDISVIEQLVTQLLG
jgi:thiol-disulfide isomerase/thioredoxin